MLFNFKGQVTTIISLALVCIGGLSYKPQVIQGGSTPVSAFNTASGTTYTEVILHDISETGQPLVKPALGGAPVYCSGKPKWSKENTAKAKIKFNGFNKSCWFI